MSQLEAARKSVGMSREALSDKAGEGASPATIKRAEKTPGALEKMKVGTYFRIVQALMDAGASFGAARVTVDLTAKASESD